MSELEFLTVGELEGERYRLHKEIAAYAGRIDASEETAALRQQLVRVDIKIHALVCM